MSYNSLDAASRDVPLQNRTIAAVQQEGHQNPAVADTDYAVKVRDNPAEGIRLIWPVCLASEAAYESAVIAGNPNPGGDPAVVTDGQILSAVQASWPPDVVVP